MSEQEQDNFWPVFWKVSFWLFLAFFWAVGNIPKPSVESRAQAVNYAIHVLILAAIGNKCSMHYIKQNKDAFLGAVIVTPLFGLFLFLGPTAFQSFPEVFSLVFQYYWLPIGLGSLPPFFNQE